MWVLHRLPGRIRRGCCRMNLDIRCCCPIKSALSKPANHGPEPFTQISCPKKGLNMWIIAVSVLMNVIGLLSTSAALILIVRDEGSWRNWLSSRRGQGALSILAGGCALLAGGQYKLVRLLHTAIRQPASESVLGSGVAAIFLIGAVLLAIGAGLL